MDALATGTHRLGLPPSSVGLSRVALGQVVGDDGRWLRAQFVPDLPKSPPAAEPFSALCRH
jgi:hypothetical protein